MLHDPLRSGALLVALSGTVFLASEARCADGFVRGDVDSSGRFEVTDAIMILRGLFGGEPDRIACEDAADVDDDGSLAVTDAIHLLEGLFREFWKNWSRRSMRSARKRGSPSSSSTPA